MTALESTRLLLDLLQREADPVAWLRDVQQRGASFDDLFVRGLVFGLAPQLAHRLRPVAADLSASVRGRFEAAYADQERRNRQIAAQVAEILAGSASQGVKPILLKGAHLAFLVYPEPGLRPMNDIDLLVGDEELPVVHKLLEELGYQGHFRDPQRGGRIVKHTGSYRRDTKHTRTTSPYLKPDTDRTVEPHTSLDESWFGLRAAMDPGAVARAEERVFHIAPQDSAAQMLSEASSQPEAPSIGMADLPRRVAEASHRGGLPGRSTDGYQAWPCRVLATEDLMHHLCLHVSFHLLMAQPPWVQYMDLALLAERRDLNWELLAERVVASGNQRFVLATLDLVRRLLNAPIPAAFLDRLRRHMTAPVLRRLPRLDLRYVLTMSQRPSMKTLKDRVRRGFIDRGAAARWASNGGEILRIWRTALEVWKTDTWMERRMP